MSKTEVKVYTSPEQFLDKERPDFKMLFDLVGFNIIVKPKMGVTLLLPSKPQVKEMLEVYKGNKAALKKYQKEVDYLKKEFHDDDETVGANLLHWLLQSLVLTKSYPDEESFSEPIINKANRMYKLKSKKKGEVELDIGKLKLNNAKSVKNLGPYKKVSFSVYDFNGKPDIFAPVYESKRQQDKKGGSPFLSLQCSLSRAIRDHLCYKVESCYKEGVKLGGIFRRLELVYVVSLMKHLKEKAPEKYQELLSVLDWDPLVSFMFILQPGCDKSLVDEELLKSLVKDTAYWLEPKAKEEYAAMMSEASLKFQNVDELVREERVNVLTQFESGASEKDLIMSYKKLFNENSSIGKTFGPQLSVYNDLLKINHDQLRNEIHKKLSQQLASLPKGDKSVIEVKRLFAEAREAIHNVDSKLVSLVNPSYWRTMRKILGMKTEKSQLKALNPFVLSSDFLYRPKSADEVRSFEYLEEEPSLDKLLQLVKQRFDHFEAINMPAFDTKQIMSAMKKLGL